jgi:hypothetical protein
MTVRSSNELASKYVPNNSPAGAACEDTAGGPRQILNTTVTYAPLPVWNESHWVGTTVTSAGMVRDHLE